MLDDEEERRVKLDAGPCEKQARIRRASQLKCTALFQRTREDSGPERGRLAEQEAPVCAAGSSRERAAGHHLASHIVILVSFLFRLQPTRNQRRTYQLTYSSCFPRRAKRCAPSGCFWRGSARARLCPTHASKTGSVK
jgi:hypothetical protein